MYSCFPPISVQDVASILENLIWKLLTVVRLAEILAPLNVEQAVLLILFCQKTVHILRKVCNFYIYDLQPTDLI